MPKLTAAPVPSHALHPPSGGPLKSAQLTRPSGPDQPGQPLQRGPSFPLSSHLVIVASMGLTSHGQFLSAPQHGSSTSLTTPPQHPWRNSIVITDPEGHPSHKGPWKSQPLAEAPVLEGEGLWSPSPTQSPSSLLEVPLGATTPFTGSIQDCGHRGAGVGSDSVVTCSGEAVSLWETTSAKQIWAVRVGPSVVGPQGAGPEVD